MLIVSRIDKPVFEAPSALNIFFFEVDLKFRNIQKFALTDRFMFVGIVR